MASVYTKRITVEVTYSLDEEQNLAVTKSLKARVEQFVKRLPHGVFSDTGVTPLVFTED